MAGGKQLQIAN